MPSDTLPDDWKPGTPLARSIGAGLLAVTIVALAGACLLNSPPRFSERHVQDTSLLRTVVDALALGGRYPTARGVEIRSLVFYTGAAMLAVLAGVHLLSGSVRTRLSLEDVLEVRDRATSPFLWWIVLVAVSFIGSVFSHAPEVCQGQTIIRVLQLAWWWPIAALLPVAYGRSLSVGLVCILGVTAAVGLWHYVARVLPDLAGARLQYPIGNELWLATCLLPGVFLCSALVVGRWLTACADLSKRREHEHGEEPGIDRVEQSPDREGGVNPETPEGDVEREMASAGGEHRPLPDGRGSAYPMPRWHWLWTGVLALAGLFILVGLIMTRSRSAAAGLVAGVFAIVALAVPRQRRLHAVLVMLVLSTMAVLAVQVLRATGSTAERAHSIRARLDFEWPYALRLFFVRPVGGNGDGAYALLAGQFAREDQLDDPNIMRLDERSWPSRAHNEFLELLADTGLLGVGAFILALCIPLYRGLQYCDRRRGMAAARGDRLLVMGLAGGLAAMIVDACATPSIREPGAMPIFLTVWACLWVMVRGEAPKKPPIPDEKPLARATVRLFGVAVCFAALLLGHRGVQDWQASRAYFESGRAMDEGRYADAISEADFASAHTLDPFRRTIAGMYAVLSRALYFDRVLSSSQDAPAQQEMEISSESLVRLNRLKHVAPRFLRLSRIEAELELNRARAYQRRGEPANAVHCQERFLAALREARSDEPFMIERVEQLWIVDGAAKPADRILWLRCLMRGGEVDSRFVMLVQQLLAMPGVVEALELLQRTAEQDLPLPPDDWRDRLSPESWRLIALIYAMTEQVPQAIEMSAKCQPMYEAAGPRLFAGHSAALHEEARFRFSHDPIGQTEHCLDLLASAFSVAYGPAKRDMVLQDVTLGRTRAIILLSADREEEARAQLTAILPPHESAELDAVVVGLYLELAGTSLAGGRFVERSIAFARRAQELVPDVPDAWFLLSHAYMLTEQDDLALEAMERLLETAPDRGAAIEALRRLRGQYADREVWEEVERRHPEIGGEPSPVTEGE